MAIEFNDRRGKFIDSRTGKSVKPNTNPKNSTPVTTQPLGDFEINYIKTAIGQKLRNKKIKGATRRTIIKLNKTIDKQTKKSK